MAKKRKSILGLVITMMLFAFAATQTVHANTENQTIIKEVQITGVKNPVGGEQPSSAEYQSAEVPADAPYTVKEIHWYDANGVEVIDSEFICGKSYSCKVIIQPAEGYYFDAAELTTGTMNGENVEIKTTFTAEDGKKWNAGEITTEATCMKKGEKTFTCTVCGKTKTEAVDKKPHKFSTAYTIDKKATQSVEGRKSKHCTKSGCTAKSSETAIPKISSQKLSYTTGVYTGKAKTAPVLTVKDAKGNKLVKGTDYSVTGLAAKTNVGRYKVTITYKGKYSGSKVLYFTIVPKKPASASVKFVDLLQVDGHDDVKFSWKASKDATGYLIYYKKATASKWSNAVATTKTSYTKKNLDDGVKYTFKVVPYYKASSGTTKYYDDNQYKTASITTKKAGSILTKNYQKYYEYYKGGYSAGKYAKNTFITLNSKTYYFDKKGKMVTGWMEKSGDYYYFDRSTGVQKKNCTIDGIKIKSNGKATENKLNIDKINVMITARQKMQEITKPSDSKEQKLKKVFKWVMPYPYHRFRILPLAKQSKGWEVVFANDIFENEKGCCVSESCAFAFLAKECGYNKVYVADDTSHAWVEINGRVYDTLFATAKSFNTYYNGTYSKAKLYCHAKLEI